MDQVAVQGEVQQVAAGDDQGAAEVPLNKKPDVSLCLN